LGALGGWRLDARSTSRPHPDCSSFAKLDADTFSAKDHLVSSVINVATVVKLDTLLLVAPTDKPSKLYAAPPAATFCECSLRT
jgi:hypothetical protein